MDSKAYSKHVGSIVEHGTVTLLLGLGRKLGIVQALCELDQPISSQDLADKLNLKERYTREWLCSMASANIIQQERETRCYHVPSEHRQALRNRSAFAPFMMMGASRVDRVMDCFHKDGPYGFDFGVDAWMEWFLSFRDEMASDTLKSEILPRISQQGLTERLESGIQVLDLGCAAGNYTLGLAEKFPRSTFIGIDMVQSALDVASERAAKQGLTNVQFQMGDAHQLPGKWTGYFDYVFVYDTLHDLPNPHRALDQLHRVLKDTGQISFVEIGFPSDPLDNIGNSAAAMYYACSTMVCLPSSMSEEPHIGFGAMWGKEAIEKTLKEHGFQIDDNDSLNLFGSKAYFLCSKASSITGGK